MAVKKTDKKPSLSEVLSSLRKDTSVGVFSDFDNVRSSGLSTGNLILDNLTGIGGIPTHRITELYGPYSSGKTTAALQCAAKVQQAGGNIVFLDYEHSLDEVYCKNLGLDVDDSSFIYVLPKHFEDGINAFRKLAATGEITLGIADSVAAMTTENELNADTGKVLVADRAKMMYQTCLTPDHKILRSDLRWVPLGECEVGDAILGFDENKPGGHRHYRRAEVLNFQRRVSSDMYRVTLTSGKQFRVTGDHQWLVGTPAGKNFTYAWRATTDLRVGRDYSPKVLDTWEEKVSKDAGWLAGMFDGEGHLNQRTETRVSGMYIGIGQTLGLTADRIEHTLKKFCGEAPMISDSEGVSPRGVKVQDFRRFGVPGPLREKLRFLGEVRPERLITKVDFDRLGRLQSWKRDPEAVVSVEKIADEEIVVMETSTGTFIADGYPMHNCRQLIPMLAQTGSGMIFLNHLLEKVDATPMGARLAMQGIKQYTTPGGKALGFYSSLRMEFKPAQKVKSNEYNSLTDESEAQITAFNVKATVVKNKVGTPFRTAEVRIRQNHGFSNESAILNILIAHGEVKKDGAWFKFPLALRYDEDVPSIQGEDAVLKKIEADPTWRSTLLEQAKQALNQNNDTFAGEPVESEPMEDPNDDQN